MRCHSRIMNVYVRFSLVHNVMIRGFPADRLTEKNNADTKERRKERVFLLVMRLRRHSIIS